jgi:hypothetical protein
VLTATNKRLLISESCSNSNWCTPHRGNLINASYASRTQSVYGTSTMHISHSLRIATFRIVINRVEQIHCRRKKGLPSQSTARWLADSWDHTQFLSHNSHWSSGEKSIFCWQYATRLTCSWGPTHRSLTDTDGGYNLGGAGLPQHSPCPSQPTVLRFPSKAPSGLKLNNAPWETSKNQVYGNLLSSHSLLTTWPSTVAYIYA